MTAQEFEQYVALVMQKLDCFNNAKIIRNHRYRGIRQPGEYEIDISVRLRLAGVLDFFLIVECKNWGRPVDRPVVQKLAQTQDALAAHKAAIASPLGFTNEAVEVAKALGIALWVVAESNSNITIIHCSRTKEHLDMLWREVEINRERLLHVGFRDKKKDKRSTPRNPRYPVFPDLDYVLADYTRVQPSTVATPSLRLYSISICHDGFSSDGEDGIDPQMALTAVADSIIIFLGESWIGRLRIRLVMFKSRLSRLFKARVSDLAYTLDRIRSRAWKRYEEGEPPDEEPPCW